MEQQTKTNEGEGLAVALVIVGIIFIMLADNSMFFAIIAAACFLGAMLSSNK